MPNVDSSVELLSKEETLVALKTAFDDAVTNYISYIDDIAVYQGLITTATQNTYSLLNNLNKNAGNYSSLTLRTVIASNQPPISTNSTTVKQTNKIAGHNQVTVTTSAAAIGTEKPSQGVWIKASKGNTNPIYVGSSSVTTSNGFILDPADQIYVHESDLNNIYAVVASGTEQLSYIAH